MAYAKPKEYPRPPYFWRRVRNRTYFQNWEHLEWKPEYGVQTWSGAEGFIKALNAKVTYWEYRLPTHCERCYATVNETYPGIGHADMIGKHVCHACHMEGLENMKATKHKSTVHGERLQGDIWTLPTVNSPMWTAQWAVQGSGKLPYIVSHKAKEPYLGNVTSEGWACSCPAFTRNTPRIPCKHCLAVMKKNGVASVWLNNKAKVAVVDMGDADAQAFAKWKREQAEAKKEVDLATAGPVKKNLWSNTGRKFR